MLLGQMLNGSCAVHSARPDRCEGGWVSGGGMGRRYTNQRLYDLQNNKFLLVLMLSNGAQSVLGKPV